MNAFLNKLDTELQVIYSTYLDYKKRGKPKKALTHPVAHGDSNSHYENNNHYFMN
ncbi:MAG: hypothetical protein QNJ60_15215 [Xenococcaceae cyanobacterium MO_188.B19]|nr:hypothetical protein [Xenococcaceae cyanobacterium MO_188.B19]